MNHLKWMGHSSTIFEIQRGLRSDLQSCEVTLVAGGGRTVKAHRFILSSCSDLLRSLLADVPIGQEATIVVPDVKGALLDSVLSFVYMGETSLTSTNLSEFLEAINILGIKSAISFECNAASASQGVAVAAPSTAASSSSPVKTLSSIQVVQEEIMETETECVVEQKMEISYSIELVPGSTSGDDFILTETNKLNQNGSTAQLEINSSAGSTAGKIEEADEEQEEEEEEEDDAIAEAERIIEEYNKSSGAGLKWVQNVIAESSPTSNSTRDLEFLDVYAEPQHKITYSIEHVPGSTSGNDFILTENSGTYTLTQNAAAAKLENASSTGSTPDKIEEADEEEEEEDDADADGIIEEYNSSNGAGEQHIIEIAAGTATVSTLTPTTTASTTANAASGGGSAAVIELKPSSAKIKTIKLTKTTRATGGDPNTSQLGHFETLKVESYTPTGSASTSFNDSGTGGRTGGATHHSPNDDTLDLAVQAVLEEGMSLQKAAHKYYISKTVLWRRVRKNPNYMKTTRENPVLSLAYERLKGGDSLKSISRELYIPMSTLHRHKVRLASQGRLPDYVTFKKRDSVSRDELKEKLAKAVHACVHEGMSQNHAANLFDIPKSTLWRHLQKRVAEAELSEGMAGLKEEEVILS